MTRIAAPAVAIVLGVLALAGLAVANRPGESTGPAFSAPALAEPPAPPRPAVGPPFRGLTAPPPSGAPARVLSVLGEIRTTLRVTRYQHPTVIRPRSGVYLWDCSGMAAWVLRRAAPASRRALASPRPVARDFFHAIDRAPVGGVRGGWTKLAGLADARPGDVFAWLRPPDWPRRNTGHVGFLLAAPAPVPEWPGAWALRIADATSIPHQNDTRPWPGDGGYGEGTIVFFADPEGRPTHYGWHGTRAGATAETRIVLGRPVR